MYKFLIAAALLTFATACQTPQDPAEHKTEARAITASNTTTTEDPEHLKFMLEEEKLARDVYNSLGESWEHRTFVNIPRSEQRHMDAVARLMEQRGLKTDVANLPPGEFEDAALQSLHDELLARGRSSKLEAFKVGALIEETDIKDLDEGLANNPPEDVRELYTNLRRASYNHLDAFVSAIEASGEEYEARVLTPDRFAKARAVGAAHHAKHRGGGEGKGKGHGHGSCEDE